ncbi:MAG: C-3',4' desaturase CrtD [Candidatus Sericytochromatia bacterium]|nr:MAG: C-3',4' desaturase CrtD [Candidatus Sericytochromatia bacterium]
MYDFIVIGSGYGGLSIATLLSNIGLSILILESHTNIGGCASFFKRKDFLFDVGATTLSGIKKNQPLGKLFNILDLKPKLKKMNIGMIVYKSNGEKVIRYSQKEKWIQECEKKFYDTLANYKGFWNEVYKIENLAWDLIDKNNNLPPRCLKDFINLSSVNNLKFINLLSGLFFPLKKLLDKYNIKNQDFINFIDNQLIISTQNNYLNSPYLTSCMGLAYPSEIYYPYGGINSTLELLLNKFKSNGGNIKLKQEVISIKRKKDFYLVKTKNKSYVSKGIISNIPIWNMKNITEGQIKKYFENISYKFDKAPGAFTIYFAVENKFNIESCYYQIHTDEKIPFCTSNSFFVSFSMDDDYYKAPKGYRTITISTHTDVEEWQNLDKKDYISKKCLIESFIMQNLYKVFPEMKNLEKLYFLSGTPKTFEFFTKRYKGFVGGIPHSIDNNFLLLLPSNVTSFENLYLVGDTVFPGQGIPAVVQGSLNVLYHIEKNFK